MTLRLVYSKSEGEILMEDLMKELDEFLEDAEAYNNDPNEDLHGHGDILETRQNYLLAKSEELMGAITQ